MTKQSVDETPPPCERAVFLHRQGVDVADAAAVEVARHRMVGRMGPLPVVVGGQGDHAEDTADDIVGAARAEVGSVPAIVLDDEKADEKARCRQGEQQRDPIAVVEGQPHAQPERDERNRRDQQLGDAAPASGAERLELADQIAGVMLRQRHHAGCHAVFGAGRDVSAR